MADTASHGSVGSAGSAGSNSPKMAKWVDPVASYDALTETNSKFNEYPKIFPGSELGHASPIFALQMAEQFMSGSITGTATATTTETDVDQVQKHNAILETSILIALTANWKDVRIDKLIAELNRQNSASVPVRAYRTTVDFITQNKTPIHHIIPTPTEDGYERFVVIFCKSHKYFCVAGAYDSDGEEPHYLIRDPSRTKQCGFHTKDELIAYLYDEYDFDKNVMIDGVPATEFSDIGYALIALEFDLSAEALIQSLRTVTARAAAPVAFAAPAAQTERMFVANWGPPRPGEEQSEESLESDDKYDLTSSEYASSDSGEEFYDQFSKNRIGDRSGFTHD